MSSSTVRLAKSTRTVLSILATAAVGVAVWLSFKYSLWASVALIVAALVLWRVQAMGVIFLSEEIVLDGFFTKRKISRAEVLRLESGSILILNDHGRERSKRIPIAFSPSAMDENTSDAKTKRELQAIFDKWHDG